MTNQEVFAVFAGTKQPILVAFFFTEEAAFDTVARWPVAYCCRVQKITLPIFGNSGELHDFNQAGSKTGHCETPITDLCLTQHPDASIY